MTENNSISRQIIEDPSLGEPCGDFEKENLRRPTPNPYSLAGSTTVITGASHGLGLTLALAVIEAGGCVACVDKANSPHTTYWNRIKQKAGMWDLTLRYHQCNLSEDDDFEKLLSHISKYSCQAGAPVRGLVACGAIMQRTPVLEYRADDFARIMSWNVTTMFTTAKHAGRLFERTGTKASIVLISSISGSIANRGITSIAYNSSKGAIQQMCRCLAQELGPHGIRVNTLSPGFIRTKEIVEFLRSEPELEDSCTHGSMLGRLAEPEELKAPVVFLLSSASSFVTGSDLRVDGGQMASG